MTDEFDTTVFEQDGVIYFACVMNPAHAKDNAREIAREMRFMPNIPRSRMRVIPTGEARTWKWGSPKGCTCSKCQKDAKKLQAKQEAML